jgi:asparagine N-glycosylation enzyme membrane subunit Stt3
LRENTEEDAVIASWWDYGYQIAGFSNRTTLVDNSEYGVRVVPEVGAAELTGVSLLITDTWNNSERTPSSCALRTEN